ncbi:uncharacterized protein BJ212DRAFT_1298530 [Suillus subaureus]|uniref:Uncharacterized protein n=1 Tax=Suillus subaureus TaxID=48587 RepID=A0A9P7JFB5_9AGAM|nr:uncharacterized protein BJ212DRAFT_1298530 [Suillus subaureus]KAG1819316.1 hypothetical protein BJ212DRAFT_1298530 [Suillus subaureus]
MAWVYFQGNYATPGSLSCLRRQHENHIRALRKVRQDDLLEVKSTSDCEVNQAAAANMIRKTEVWDSGTSQELGAQRRLILIEELRWMVGKHETSEFEKIWEGSMQAQFQLGASVLESSITMIQTLDTMIRVVCNPTTCSGRDDVATGGNGGDGGGGGGGGGDNGGGGGGGGGSGSGSCWRWEFSASCGSPAAAMGT